MNCTPEQCEEFTSILEGRHDGTVGWCHGQTATVSDVLLGYAHRYGEVTQLEWMNFEEKSFMAAFGKGIILVCSATAEQDDRNHVLQCIRLQEPDPESMDASEGAGSQFRICPNGLAMAAASANASSASVLVYGTPASLQIDIPVGEPETRLSVESENGDRIFGMKLPHPSPVHCFAWSPKVDDRATVAVGQEDGGVALWSVDPTGFGKPEHRCLLWGHPEQAVTHLEFREDIQ